jgi:hypothetical protein
MLFIPCLSTYDAKVEPFVLSHPSGFKYILSLLSNEYFGDNLAGIMVIIQRITENIMFLASISIIICLLLALFVVLLVEIRKFPIEYPRYDLRYWVAVPCSYALVKGLHVLGLSMLDSGLAMSRIVCVLTSGLSLITYLCVLVAVACFVKILTTRKFIFSRFESYVLVFYAGVVLAVMLIIGIDECDKLENTVMTNDMCLMSSSTNSPSSPTSDNQGKSATKP